MASIENTNYTDDQLDKFGDILKKFKEVFGADAVKFITHADRRNTSYYINIGSETLDKFQCSASHLNDALLNIALQDVQNVIEDQRLHQLSVVNSSKKQHQIFGSKFLEMEPAIIFRLNHDCLQPHIFSRLAEITEKGIREELKLIKNDTLKELPLNSDTISIPRNPQVTNSYVDDISYVSQIVRKPQVHAALKFLYTKPYAAAELKHVRFKHGRYGAPGEQVENRVVYIYTSSKDIDTVTLKNTIQSAFGKNICHIPKGNEFEKLELLGGNLPIAYMKYSDILLLRSEILDYKTKSR